MFTDQGDYLHAHCGIVLGAISYDDLHLYKAVGVGMLRVRSPKKAANAKHSTPSGLYSPVEDSVL